MIKLHFVQNDTYDHRTLKIRLPVRSAIYKQCTGGLVVRWVTTSESPLLYVFCFFVSHLFQTGRFTRGVRPLRAEERMHDHSSLRDRYSGYPTLANPILLLEHDQLAALFGSPAPLYTALAGRSQGFRVILSPASSLVALSMLSGAFSFSTQSTKAATGSM